MYYLSRWWSPKRLHGALTSWLSFPLISTLIGATFRHSVQIRCLLQPKTQRKRLWVTVSDEVQGCELPDRLFQGIREQWSRGIFMHSSLRDWQQVCHCCLDSGRGGQAGNHQHQTAFVVVAQRNWQLKRNCNSPVSERKTFKNKQNTSKETRDKFILLQCSVHWLQCFIAPLCFSLEPITV